ncbi:hypothetical protein ACIBFB_23535 [Nocardiopsis sp. NPDC050513]|uniref:hypothetical protein n=1 Tax=Nocardiopsis sp. NPDC050513 TaxID=3364338 RepID=UPI003791E886
MLGVLGRALGGPRLLRARTGRDDWPSHGVYFFFEPGELRPSGDHRVVRVGTHALKRTSRTTLWKRLAQHRGNRSGGGNHRASVFRHHVGAALIGRDGGRNGLLEAWSAPSRSPAWEIGEAEVERRVSERIGRMPVLWLPVPTRADGTSDRGFVERNCIALLSGTSGALETPSRSWLGHHAVSPRVRASGLWNVNHVDDPYDPAVLDLMRDLVRPRPARGAGAEEHRDGAPRVQSPLRRPSVPPAVADRVDDDPHGDRATAR